MFSQVAFLSPSLKREHENIPVSMGTFCLLSVATSLNSCLCSSVYVQRIEGRHQQTDFWNQNSLHTWALWYISAISSRLLRLEKAWFTSVECAVIKKSLSNWVTAKGTVASLIHTHNCPCAPKWRDTQKESRRPSTWCRRSNLSKFIYQPDIFLRSHTKSGKLSWRYCAVIQVCKSC